MISNSTLTVNLDTIAQNASAIKRALNGAELIPVLKGNAYGHGQAEIYSALRPAIEGGHIAVAHMSEAAVLCEAGCSERIMLVSGFPTDAISEALDMNVILPIGDPVTAKAVSDAASGAVSVQIKLNCGLNRFGAKPGAELDELIRTIKLLPKLNVVGVYTHFSLIDHIDRPAAQTELNRFLDGVSQLSAAGINPPLRHAAASNVSEWYPESHLDACRVGRRLFIGPPAEGAADDGTITESGTWSSTVTALKHLSAGERFGYGGTFEAKRPTEIAILGVGHADGVVAELCAVGAPILIDGRRGRLIGANMDCCYVDVTECGARVGSEVIFFGHSATGAVLTVREVAATIGAEGVFLTSKLTSRVNRKYL